jgi:hypothetical protein
LAGDRGEAPRRVILELALLIDQDADERRVSRAIAHDEIEIAIFVNVAGADPKAAISIGLEPRGGLVGKVRRDRPTRLRHPKSSHQAQPHYQHHQTKSQSTHEDLLL